MFSSTVNHPQRVLAAAALILLLLLPGVARVQVVSDARALIPLDSPVLLSDAWIRSTFGIGQEMIVALGAGGRDGVYNPYSLELLAALTEDIGTIDGVGRMRVRSLANQTGLPIEDGGSARTLLDPLPQTPGQIAELRREVEAVPAITRRLVDADGRAAAIRVGIPYGADVGYVYHSILSVIADHEPIGGEIHVAGASVLESQLGRHMATNPVRLLPLLAILVPVLLYWLTGSWMACLLALVKGVGVLVATVGVMGWAQVPIYATTAAIAPVLFALSLGPDIHLLERYQHRLDDQRPSPDRPRLVLSVTEAVLRPILIAGATTALSFLSFILSRSPGISTFGAYLALGIAVSVVWSITVTPSLLTLLGHRLFRNRWELSMSSPAFEQVLGEVTAWVQEQQRRLLFIGVAILVLAGVGLAKLHVEDDWTENFAKRDPIAHATRFVNTRLPGAHRILVAVAADADLTAPEQRTVVQRFERFLTTLAGVGAVSGPADYLDNIERIGASPSTVAEHSHADRLAALDAVWGPLNRRHVLADDLRHGLITLDEQKSGGTHGTAVLEAIRDYETLHLRPHGLRVELGGDLTAWTAVKKLMVATQVRSIAFSLLGLLLVACLFSGSFTQGLCSTLPVITACTLTFAIFGLAAIPLGVGAAMVAAVILGVGVDYGVHYTERYRQLFATGLSYEAAAQATALASGRAIAVDAFTVGCGVGILLLTPAPASSRVGLLAVMGVGLSYATTMLVLPALLPVWKPPFLNRGTRTKTSPQG